VGEPTPIYGFVCARCEKGFEVALTLAEQANAKVKCPSCGGEKITSQGQLVCGRLTEQDPPFEGRDANFAPAMPFVTGLSGVIGSRDNGWPTSRAC
jgi:putative FmdB family regulatory protein